MQSTIEEGTESLNKIDVDMQPLVTCIMPTANRRGFVRRAASQDGVINDAS